MSQLNGQSENGAIVNLNGQLNQLYNNVQGSQVGADATLLKQNEVNSILEAEQSRLLEKKQNIDTAIQGQQRMIELNQNYQMRYAVYTRMLMVVVLLLFVCYVLSILSTWLTIIPSAIYTLLYIIVITGCLVYLYILYAGLKQRNPVNYNEVLVPPPLNVGAPGPGASTNASGVSAAYTSEFGSYYGCIGQNCCAPGIAWSPLTGCALTPAAAPAPAR